MASRDRTAVLGDPGEAAGPGVTGHSLPSLLPRRCCLTGPRHGMSHLGGEHSGSQGLAELLLP